MAWTDPILSPREVLMTSEQHAAKRAREANMARLEREREKYPIDIERNLSQIEKVRRALRRAPENR
jgi:hypothetical protein